MSGIFRFKQFEVNQSGCAMKINTDGVLLGALTQAAEAATILDIGTGTGVIALMLAQRFANAAIDAVEIDSGAAQTATLNFKNSPFANRLAVTQSGFQQYFDEYPHKRYDVIISNPPFYIDNLRSPSAKTNLAKHTDEVFFEELISHVSRRLNPLGSCWLVLPPSVAQLVRTMAPGFGLHVNQAISIRSFADSELHREILVLSPQALPYKAGDFVIYDAPKKYSTEYKALLKDFFTIF